MPDRDRTNNSLYVKLIVRSCAPDGNGDGGGDHPASGVPATPTHQAATTLNSSSIQLTWHDTSSNETGFYVTNGNVTLKVAANTTSYTWSGLHAGQYMCLAVSSFNAAGQSTWTPYACVTTPS
ncbi:hypothetical protein Acor_79740 [Acrocarpospora corrugata]|uniref:Fibronectin type-III domain-containing protein n=1 Tax=Acrocarpospora corrugata TaxID=35763 RepID=A0A5M3WA12_9ACTN|nr:hypothetical protein Acor_79740 [Acrocarpospora corrugata]